MPLRLRITLLFSLLVCIILSFVFLIIYYYSVLSREKSIEARLTNVAITTGRFLSRAETFNPSFIQKIDSLTAIAFTHKTIIVYDSLNRRAYSFNDDDEDTLSISPQKLNSTRWHGKLYEVIDKRDVVFYHFKNQDEDTVIIAAGYDIYGLKGLNRLFFILLVSFVTGLTITLISGYFFSSQLLKPLAKIAEDAREISAQNLTRRIQRGKSKDEWYKLADTLNDLLNRLQESFDMQQRFIANASHEISTPLTSISSQLQVSLQNNRDADEYKKVIQSVYKDVRHMSKLTSTLLEMAKAAGDRGGLEFKFVRIDEILLTIPADIMKARPGYEVELSYDQLPEDDEQLIVFGNETLLFSAIKNIVLNACKYSEDHKARMKLGVVKNNIIIQIEDKGKGIPETELENIFEPFYRIDDTTTDGFGLGLALVKRIIHLHHGFVSVASEKNQGTCFTIKLPVAAGLRLSVI